MDADSNLRRRRGALQQPPTPQIQRTGEKSGGTFLEPLPVGFPCSRTEPEREAADPRPLLIGMTVTPIPVVVLLGMIQLGVITILDVILPKVHAVGAVFAIVPVVVILVGAVVDASLFPVVVLVLVLAFVV